MLLAKISIVVHGQIFKNNPNHLVTLIIALNVRLRWVGISSRLEMSFLPKFSLEKFIRVIRKCASHFNFVSDLFQTRSRCHKQTLALHNFDVFIISFTSIVMWLGTANQCALRSKICLWHRLQVQILSWAQDTKLSNFNSY